MKTLAVNATWQKQSLQGAILFRAKLSGSKILAARIRLVIITSRSTKQRNTKRSLKILLIVLKETKNDIYFTFLSYLCKRVTKLSKIPINPAKPVMAVSTPEIAKCHKDKSSSSGLPQEDIMRSVIDIIVQLGLLQNLKFERTFWLLRLAQHVGCVQLKDIYCSSEIININMEVHDY